MYPFLFSTSFLRISADLFTHASISLTGIWAYSFVNSLRGAVNFGTLALSFLVFEGFLAFGDFASLGVRGELDVATDRPLRVLMPEVDCDVTEGVSS